MKTENENKTMPQMPVYLGNSDKQRQTSTLDNIVAKPGQNSLAYANNAQTTGGSYTKPDANANKMYKTMGRSDLEKITQGYKTSQPSGRQSSTLPNGVYGSKPGNNMQNGFEAYLMGTNGQQMRMGYDAKSDTLKIHIPYAGAESSKGASQPGIYLEIKGLFGGANSAIPYKTNPSQGSYGGNVGKVSYN